MGKGNNGLALLNIHFKCTLFMEDILNELIKNEKIKRLKPSSVF